MLKCNMLRTRRRHSRSEASARMEADRRIMAEHACKANNPSINAVFADPLPDVPPLLPPLFSDSYKLHTMGRRGEEQHHTNKAKMSESDEVLHAAPHSMLVSF